MVITIIMMCSPVSGAGSYNEAPESDSSVEHHLVLKSTERQPVLVKTPESHTDPAEVGHAVAIHTDRSADG